VYFYAAGTTTPQAAYAADGTTPLANPLTLDANGATYFLLGDTLTYKIDLTDSIGTPVTGWPVDQITSQNAAVATAMSNLAATGTGQGAEMVGYKEPFTGAVARTQALKNGDVFSVKDFGAIGDGTHDDTSAIQAAIDALNPYIYNASFDYTQGGGTVFFPRGIYRITSTIKLPAYVTLKGSGRGGWSSINSKSDPADGTCILADFASPSTTIAIDSSGYNSGVRYSSLALLPVTNFLGGTTTYTHGCGVEDMAILSINDGTGANGTIPVAVGIRFQGSPMHKVRSVSIFGFTTPLVTANCWVFEQTDLMLNGVQVAAAYYQCNAFKVTGDFDCNGVSAGIVTAGNKPTYWDSLDTNYTPTSIYVVQCRAAGFPTITTQHAGRGMYVSGDALGGGLVACGVAVGNWYHEITGAEYTSLNAAGCNLGILNADYSNIIIQQLYCDTNGLTLFGNLNNNSSVTLLGLTGIYGLMYGTASTGLLYIGPSVVRNSAFPDTAFDKRQINLAPGQFAVTGITGTNIVGASTYSGVAVKRGNVYDLTITIAGSNMSTTIGSSGVYPHTGNNGIPVALQPTAVAVAACNAGGALVASGVGYWEVATATVWLPTISGASITKIIVSFTLFSE
jgi:hypothetical protein